MKWPRTLSEVGGDGRDGEIGRNLKRVSERVMMSEDQGLGHTAKGLTVRERSDPV